MINATAGAGNVVHSFPAFQPKHARKTEQRQAAILRSRALHEQRRAAGKCDRCAKRMVSRYWYCLKCRIELSQLRATARAARKHFQVEVITTERNDNA